MPELQLDVTADAAAAATSLGSVGDAARSMGDDVAAASDTAAGGLSRATEGADAMAGSAGKATGAFGALAGGLEAAGYDGAAAGLQGIAVATDFASGAGDLFNLVLDSQAAQFLIQKARMVASIAITGAQTVATGAATAAQWLWNAALSANPIGLVVAGVALLVGGLILAYNKVGPFRDAVDTAMGIAKDGVGLVVDGLDTLVGWVEDATGGWDGIQEAAEDALTPVVGAVDAVSSAMQAAIGWVQDLIDWLSKIDVPDIDIPFVGRNAFAATGGKPTAGTGDAGGDGGPTGLLSIQLTVEPPADKDRATEDMVAALREYYARRGQTLTLTAAR